MPGGASILPVDEADIDLDTSLLDINRLHGTVVIKGLRVTAAPLFSGLFGTDVLKAGTPLLSLDLRFPKL